MLWEKLCSLSLKSVIKKKTRNTNKKNLTLKILSLNLVVRINMKSYHVPVKAIPVTGRGGPQDCEMSRLPHFLDS
jgi:hypothetical protein